MLAASEWYVQDNYNKLNKPVDKAEWHMTPQTVNAYYNPTTNEICFPAGILQAPYFDITADDAMNYGAIGVVIGHEMTHGFDDSGRQFDAQGNLRDWWTEDDAKALPSWPKPLRLNSTRWKLLPVFMPTVILRWVRILPTREVCVWRSQPIRTQCAASLWKT